MVMKMVLQSPGKIEDTLFLGLAQCDMGGARTQQTSRVAEPLLPL